MADKLTMQVDDLSYAQLMAALNRLGSVEKEAAIKQGMNEGLTIIVREGKTNLASRNKVNTGNLTKSFKTTVDKKNISGYAGFKRPSGAHAHLVDRGTKQRKTRKGWNRGQVTGSKFWTDAFNSKKQEAGNRLVEAIKKSLKQILDMYH